MSLKIEDLKKEFKKLANPQIAQHSQRFFKTGKGEYGEGDLFLGIRVPILRKLVKKYKILSLKEWELFLKSPFHEERLFALLGMVMLFKKGDEKEKNEIYQTYLKNTNYVNNWDLVDSSAHYIVGGYLIDKKKEPLYRLALSNLLWERRISIMATYYFIRHNFFVDTLKIAKLLLQDKEDLIHKAVGWMLREVGKREEKLLIDFLEQHSKKMPRIMLSYALEKFSREKKRFYLKR